jgi:DNA mismatch repair protein MutS
MQSISKQYEAIKAKYPDAILLFRVGDFYEAFGEDAKALQKHLGTQLTISDERTVASLPFQSLDHTLKKLIEAGYKVAICEELEDAKRVKGKIQRGVTDYLK